MELVSFIYEIAASIIDAVIAIGFMTTFFGMKQKNAKYQVMLGMAAIFLNAQFMTDYYVLQSVLIPVILFIYARIALRGSIRKQMIVICIFVLLNIFISLFTIQLLSLLLRVTNAALTMEEGIPRLIILSINRIIIILSYFVLVRKLHRKMEMKAEEWVLVCAYFLIDTFVSMLLLIWSSVYDLTRTEQICAVFFGLSMLFFTAGSLFLLNRISVKNEYLLQNQMLKLQIEEQEKSILHMRIEQDNVRAMRHDMNRRLDLYCQCLKEGRMQEVVELLQNQIEEISADKYIVIRGNSLISAVLTQKKELCQKENISFDYEIGSAVASHIEMDIALMLSNLLDNAIEAERRVEGSRAVMVGIFTCEDRLNIIVKNRIEESVLDQNPDLKTTKANKKQHGYGVKNIRSIVEKLGGMMRYFEEQDMFVFQMLMDLKE